MRHATTILRGIGALIVTLVFVIAVPVGLISYVGWPLPATLPTLDEIQLALRSGIDPQLLINTLAVIVWIVWFQLVIALTAETIAAVRGGTARRLPVLPGLQPAVAQARRRHHPGSRHARPTTGSSRRREPVARCDPPDPDPPDNFSPPVKNRQPSPRRRRHRPETPTPIDRHTECNDTTPCGASPKRPSMTVDDGERSVTSTTDGP